MKRLGGLIVVLVAGNALADDSLIIHTVRADETLACIAGEYLGNPYRWREIIELNPQVRQPEELEIGDQLAIVHDTDFAPVAGTFVCQPTWQPRGWRHKTADFLELDRNIRSAESLRERVPKKPAAGVFAARNDVTARSPASSATATHDNGHTSASLGRARGRPIAQADPTYISNMPMTDVRPMTGRAEVTQGADGAFYILTGGSLPAVAMRNRRAHETAPNPAPAHPSAPPEDTGAVSTNRIRVGTKVVVDQSLLRKRK
ncbi:MAG: LysM peptidoglycan-binding domain-containing protein [Gammaproteobacteria bacterium]|nr:LysM peptidoglycan-binding domain-containing protein [Gammaproteobacteria bacterium]